ncbi:MAG: hypothetical protein ACI9CE_003587 [Flavobacterium sp.]
MLHKKIKIDLAIGALLERLEELNFIDEALAEQIGMALEAHVEVEKKVFPKTLVKLTIVIPGSQLKKPSAKYYARMAV